MRKQLCVCFFLNVIYTSTQYVQLCSRHLFWPCSTSFFFLSQRVVWQVGAKYSKIFSVTPSEGFVRPGHRKVAKKTILSRNANA